MFESNQIYHSGSRTQFQGCYVTLYLHMCKHQYSPINVEQRTLMFHPNMGHPIPKPARKWSHREKED